MKVNGHEINSWVLDDDGKREEGMQWLTADDVKDDDGMLFAFREAATQVPPTGNTVLALDIVYISPEFKVLNIEQGIPYDGQPKPSKGVAMLALEMKQGSTKRLGIVPGMTITVPDGIRRTNQLKDLQRVKLTANSHPIQAWVMDDEPKRREGMMWLNLSEVADDDGMIFVFVQAKEQRFWMHNTVIPLDVIYIGLDKKVLNVQPGKSFDESALPSDGKAIYVLEMKQGAAKRLRIARGTAVDIPVNVAAKE